MSYFQLTNSTGNYEFDVAGGVSIAGVNIGSWTTNAINQIVTGSLAFDVSWVFNAQNQLTIQSNGVELFNFSGAGLYNSFTTLDTALVVKPDRTAAFSFTLHGDWTLTADHNLTFRVGGIASTLDGFISDLLGRFIFHFTNLDNVLETNVLGFAGSWQSRLDPSRTPLLDFHYQTSSGEKIFELPKAVAVNRSSNQLTYTYTKNNKTLSIDFQGTLLIGANFEITYVVEPQISSSGAQMVASTTLSFKTSLAQPNLRGDLELAAGASTLTIGGQSQGVLGKTSLQLGFTFTQMFPGAGNQITRTAAFSGTLAFNSGQVQWTFSATGTTINLAIGVDIKLGGVQLDARLNLPMDRGQTAGVTFLLGVSF
jgi:hypothetical protein